MKLIFARSDAFVSAVSLGHAFCLRLHKRATQSSREVSYVLRLRFDSALHEFRNQSTVPGEVVSSSLALHQFWVCCIHQYFDLLLLAECYVLRYMVDFQVYKQLFNKAVNKKVSSD